MPRTSLVFLIVLLVLLTGGHKQRCCCPSDRRPQADRSISMPNDERSGQDRNDGSSGQERVRRGLPHGSLTRAEAHGWRGLAPRAQKKPRARTAVTPRPPRRHGRSRRRTALLHKSTYCALRARADFDYDPLGFVTQQDALPCDSSAAASAGSSGAPISRRLYKLDQALKPKLDFKRAGAARILLRHLG